MIASGIEVEVGGAPLRFALPFAQLRAVQAETDVGPAVLLQQLCEAPRLVNAVRAVIRSAREGAGASFEEAEAFVRERVDPFAEMLLLARGILAAWSVATSEAVKVSALSRKTDDDPDPSGKLDFGSYIGAAAAAGIQGVDAMDFADLVYAIAGWRTAHCAPPKPEPPSLKAHEAAKQRWAAMQKKEHD